jgi:hypothetical protein
MQEINLPSPFNLYSQDNNNITHSYENDYISVAHLLSPIETPQIENNARIIGHAMARNT